MSESNQQEVLVSNEKNVSNYTEGMRFGYGVLVVLLCVAALCMAGASVISCDDILVRNANLCEFSAFGVVPLIMPILLAAVHFSHMHKSTKELLYTLMLALTSVCHAHAVRASYNWLIEVCDGRVEYHYGLYVLPMILFGIFLACYLYERINFKGIIEYCTELVESENYEKEN